MRTDVAAHRVSGVLLVALLVACGGSSDSTGPYGGGNTITGGNNNGYGGNGGGNNNNAAPNTVVIANASFSPETLTVAVGARVMFQNNDAIVHTATADGGSFDTSDIASGTSAAQAFAAAGVYAYHCAIHAYMHGVIKVQ